MRNPESKESEKRWISPEDLFAAIVDSLQEGNSASFTVTGMSMWPLICHGRDQVIIEKSDPEQLKVGDIVLFRTAFGNYILHRITRMKDGRIQTTGDGNFFRDGWVSSDLVIAKAVKVVRLDRVIDLSKRSWRFYGRLWMTLYPIRPILFKCWSFLRKFIKRR